MRDERGKLFEEIYRTYKEDLQRFIFSLSLRNADDMDDIFQNTMEAAYKNLKKLKNESKMSSWIFSIAKQEVKRYYRRKQRYVDHEVDELDVDILSIADLEDFVKDLVDADELVQLINGLSDNMQSIILLHYYYDLPLVEISEIRQINLNTVKSIHKRALAQIKARLEREGAQNEG